MVLSSSPLKSQQPRLRSTAKYSVFKPQALATSSTLTSTLAAISSRNEVILFDVTQPYEPLSLFHSAHNNAQTFNLQFSRDSKMIAASYDASVLIYDCTGEALMPLITRVTHSDVNANSGGSSNIMNASGRGSRTGSNSLTRSGSSSNINMNMNNSKSGSDRNMMSNSNSGDTFNHIRSLAWKTKHSQSQNHQELITCSSRMIAQWDLRCTHTSDRMRPTVSFTTSSVDHEGSLGGGFISVTSAPPASSNEGEIATMSANGIVTIYDERMSRRKSGGNNGSVDEYSCDFVTQFQSHDVGFGIDALESHFVTWGMSSAPNEGAVSSIKVWSDGRNSKTIDTNYWYMDNDAKATSSSTTTDATKSEETSTAVAVTHKCVKEIDVENLTTVKIPSHPLQNGIVAISTPTATTAVSSSTNVYGNEWQADLWSMSSTSASSSSNKSADNSIKGIGVGKNSLALEHLASFRSGGIEDASFLSQMVGDDYNNGHMIAAELSCVLSSVSNSDTDEHSSNVKDEKKVLDKDDGSCSLLLCCLNSSGYITTHLIPEAAALHFQNGGNKLSGDRVHEDGSPFRYTAGMQSNDSLAKIYRSSSDNDPANVMNSVGFREKIGLSDDSILFNAKSISVNDLFISKGSIEGGQMQFDLDDHNEFDLDHVDLAISNTSAVAQAIAEENLVSDILDNNKVDDQLTQEIDLTKTIRVPCPRMCGAVFCNGGELIAFDNGQVKNMWSWYSSSDQQSQIGDTSVKSDLARTKTGQLSFLKLEDGMSKSLEEVEGRQVDRARAFPRSLYDLVKMNEAAKVAQWGNERDDEDDDNPGRGSSDSDESDDSDSDGSSTSGSDDSYDANMRSSSTAIYDKYFGKGAHPINLNETVSADSSIPPAGRQRSDSFVGPVMENLSSRVILVREKVGYVLNGQCPELADMWILGPWRDQDIRTDQETNIMRTQGSRYDIAEEMHPFMNPVPVSIKQSRRNVLHLGSSLRTNGLSPDLQRGEKMIGNLQKLYYSDSKGPPLDQRVMQKGNSTVSFQEPTTTRAFCTVPNVKTISASADMRPKGIDMNHLRHKQEICLHNARCSAAIGQNDKADVWNIIGKMIGNISSQSYDDFDGWHGINGSALERQMLTNILQYYEMHGDVQMLATIVSVLGSGRTQRERELQKKSTFDILLPDDGAKYDLYIHVYGSLLYSWGKLTTRVELNKHLSSSVQRNGNSLKNKKEKGAYEMFAPCCPRCNQATSGKNVCQNCQDYAFRCSICTNAVRGLFTLCIQCGHGGHVNHLMPWFAENSQCPTGCGCNCTLANYYQNGDKPKESNASIVSDGKGTEPLFCSFVK